jgi:hypothetical protein
MTEPRCFPRHALAALLVLSAFLPACATEATTRPGSFAVVNGEQVAPPAIRMGNHATVRKVLDLSHRDPRVMEHLNEICGTFGPRLTGSTACEDAGRWAQQQFTAWGLDNARMEPWTEVNLRFDRLESTGELVRPASRRAGRGNRGGDAPPAEDPPADPWEVDRTLEFTTLSWTVGTEGPVVAPVVRMPGSMAEFEQNADRYRGAWVLLPAVYADRRGVRGIGFSMRQRSDLRRSIRLGEYDPAADPEPESWAGTARYEGTDLELVFRPLRDDDDKIAGGTIEIPGVAEAPIADVAHEGDSLRFVWLNPDGHRAVELTIDGAKMTGLASGEHAITLEQKNGPDTRARTRDQDRVLAAVLNASPAGFISPSMDERVWTTRGTQWSDSSPEDLPRDIEISIRRSDYDAINSRLADGQEVHARFHLNHRLARGPIPVYNTVAEIVGTEFPDEVVIVSAHLDSWDGPGSQGTVDNGTGAAVVMEAARLLALAGARPKRTIRFILWTGEEQGLLGSRAYVDKLSEDERAKISAVFVDDGGTNYQGGLPAADFMVPYLAAATAPVNGVFYSETDGDHLNVNVRPTGERIQTHGGSDHASFNAVGIPGFYWDEVGRADYGYGWHTQNDRLDLAIEEYLVQSAACMAITAYNLASAPTLLPRAPGANAPGQSLPVADGAGR